MIRRLRQGLAALALNEQGSTAVAFGLVCGVFKNLIVGGMDAGRLAWTINIDKAATRSGARLAAVSPIVAEWMQTDLSGCANVNGNGQTVAATGFPVMTCTATADNLGAFSTSCTASGVGATKTACAPTADADATTFKAIVGQMQRFDASIKPNNVQIEYAPIGLGVVGDPASCDISPLVTVRLVGMKFHAGSAQLFNQALLNLPPMSSALTSEHQIQSAQDPTQTAFLATSRCPKT